MKRKPKGDLSKEGTKQCQAERNSDASDESLGGRTKSSQTKWKSNGQKRKAEDQAGKLKADGESESSQRKRKVEGQGTKQKVGTESSGGTKVQTKRKGKAKRG